MRIVALTGQGLEHEYVIRALDRAFGAELVAVIHADPPSSFGGTLRRWWRRYSLAQLVSRVRWRIYRKLRGLDERRARTLERVLFDGVAPSVPVRGEIRHVVPGHNHSSCLALLTRAAPDVIVVYGTAVIRSAVIATAKGRIVNMHTGLSPHYRGSDTIFWALHEGDPNGVGVTVHLLTEGIDAGPILHLGRPTIEGTDDEDSLFAKCVVRGTELLIRAVRETHLGTAAALPQQPGVGREFRFVDRTVAAERRTAKRLRDGLLRKPAAAGG